uniref:Proactivator polypeptide n=2 Tax=Bursaphelenchus xylophilus TaxID=6326 RepID=A0A1I7S3S6_BURXY
MNRSVIALGLMAVLAYAHIDDQEVLLKENRIPKIPHPEFGSVCDECQVIIKKIVEAAKDPTKLAELKLILSALCHETSYEEECHVFVSKLDLFLDKLLPYLKDSEKFCTEMHLCKNSKIDMFHRIGLLYAKKYVGKLDNSNNLVCEECQFAAGELQKVVDDRETQAKVRQFLSDNVCKHLGQYQGSCDILVDDFLPELFQELHTLLNDPKEFCEHLQLCRAEQLLNKEKAEIPVEGAFKALMERVNSVSDENQFSGLGCIQCKIFGGILLKHLREDKNTKALGDDLRKLVCPILPKHWFEGCEDFLNFYAQPTVFLALSQVTEQKLCKAIHACDDSTLIGEDTLAKAAGLDCALCHSFSKLLGHELEQPEVRIQLVQEAKSYVCGNIFVFKEPCKKMMTNFMSSVLLKVLRYIESNQFCPLIHRC